MKDIGNSRKEDTILTRNLPEYIPILWKKFTKENIIVKPSYYSKKNCYAFAIFYNKGKIIKKERFNYKAGLLIISGDKYTLKWDIKLYIGKITNDYKISNKYKFNRKVSVIIPAKDNQLPLNKTLASLTIQTIKPYEIIVCDDNSNIPLKNNILSKDFNINIIRNKKTLGPAASRNRAIRIAKGEIILCLDADMIADKNLIKEHLKYHEDYSNRAILGNREFIKPSKISIEEIKMGLLEKKIPSLLTKSKRTGKDYDSRKLKYLISNNLKEDSFPWMYFSTCNLSFTKHSFNIVGDFNEKFKGWGYEDNELGFRMFKEIRNFKIIPNINAKAYHQEHMRDLDKMKRDSNINFKIFQNTVKKWEKNEYKLGNK